MRSDAYKRDLEGYAEIERERDICRKYGIDYRLEEGAVARILDRLHPEKLDLVVSEIIRETSTAATLRMVSPDRALPPFQAGQYLSIAVEIDGIRTSRPYSISSSPCQTAYYDLTVRRKEGGFVSPYLLDAVHVGDRLTARSPAGTFTYNPLIHGDDLVFLAGGSGITPFMSMIREATDRNLARKIHLIYGSEQPDDVIFHDELRERAARHGNFTYSLVISNPPEGYEGLTGFVTADLICAVMPHTPGRTYYICGPEQMYTFCLPEIEKLGPARRKIRKEVYGPPASVAADVAWPQEVSPEREFTVHVARRDRITARAGEPLLVALERAGIAVPSSCRSGECSLCRMKLMRGRVFQPRGACVRKSDARFGYVHACMAYPLEDLEVMF